MKHSFSCLIYYVKDACCKRAALVRIYRDKETQGDFDKKKRLSGSEV